MTIDFHFDKIKMRFNLITRKPVKILMIPVYENRYGMPEFIIKKKLFRTRPRGFVIVASCRNNQNGALYYYYASTRVFTLVNDELKKNSFNRNFYDS